MGGLALDGKTLRGARQRGAPGAHRLSAVAHRLDVVRGQVAVEAGGAVAAATELLAGLALTGRVVTVDAGLTHAGLAAVIVERGGDDLMVVKANQPTVREDLGTLFDDPTTSVAVAETTDLHGGCLEQRRLRAPTDLTGSTDWPGLQPALCLDRTVTEKRTGAVRCERAYAVTSLGPARATAADLLTLWREHWHCEIV